jgi:hypothetical protein
VLAAHELAVLVVDGVLARRAGIGLGCVVVPVARDRDARDGKAEHGDDERENGCKQVLLHWDPPLEVRFNLPSPRKVGPAYPIGYPSIEPS